MDEMSYNSGTPTRKTYNYANKGVLIWWRKSSAPPGIIWNRYADP